MQNDINRDIKQKLKNTDEKLKGVFLAPMAGISDAPFRTICLEHGADLVFSEMISAKGLMYKDKTTHSLIARTYEDEPLAIQIFGSDIAAMQYASGYISEHNPVLIDINMGCPVTKIVKNNEGSALMKDIKKAFDVAKSVVVASSVPVSVKFRSGFDKSNLNYIEFAKAMEQAGVSYITLHARTKDMYYSGKADWDHIAKVRQAVNIPVIANGDVWHYEDIQKIKDHTRCDLVMIARGAMGNPWIFSGKTVDLNEKKEVFIRHCILQIDFSGIKKGVLEMRKHAGWYFKGYPNSARFREMIFNAETMDDIYKCLDLLEQ